MSKRGTADLWDRIAPSFDRVGPRFFSDTGRRLVELARVDEGAALLDVAMGRGAILFPAAEKVGPDGRVIGIDLSPVMVRKSIAQVKRDHGHILVENPGIAVGKEVRSAVQP